MFSSEHFFCESDLRIVLIFACSQYTIISQNSFFRFSQKNPNPGLNGVKCFLDFLGIFLILCMILEDNGAHHSSLVENPDIKFFCRGLEGAARR